MVQSYDAVIEPRLKALEDARDSIDLAMSHKISDEMAAKCIEAQAAIEEYTTATASIKKLVLT